jgi:hypothetical protein
MRINGRKVPCKPEARGYAAVRRVWKKGDRLELQFPLEPLFIMGDHMNAGKIAVMYGPLVLAADEALLGRGPALSVVAENEPNSHIPLSAVAAAGPDLRALKVKPEPAPEFVKTWDGARVFRINAVLRRPVGTLKKGTSLHIRLIPFADAGGTGSQYKIWLPLPRSDSNGNVLLDGQQSRSRRGNVEGSINDDDLQTVVVTFNGKPAAEDWFAVSMDGAVTLKRILFAHGRTFHDGGWFDASPGKPRVQVKSDRNGEWQTVGELKDYPATTAGDSVGLQDGERFTFQFPNPTSVWAVRILGKPASGDNPAQAFSSCAELQGFGSE